MTATAASYRLRAEELRTLSDLDCHPQTRNALVEIAKSYDQMARNVDYLDRSNETLRKRH